MTNFPLGRFSRGVPYWSQQVRRYLSVGLTSFGAHPISGSNLLEAVTTSRYPSDSPRRITHDKPEGRHVANDDRASGYKGPRANLNRCHADNSGANRRASTYCDAYRVPIIGHLEGSIWIDGPRSPVIGQDRSGAYERPVFEHHRLVDQGVVLNLDVASDDSPYTHIGSAPDCRSLPEPGSSPDLGEPPNASGLWDCGGGVHLCIRINHKP